MEGAGDSASLFMSVPAVLRLDRGEPPKRTRIEDYAGPGTECGRRACEPAGLGSRAAAVAGSPHSGSC